MERRLTYTISEEADAQKVKYFLRKQGYSGQNLIALKSRPDNVLVNDTPVFLTHPLQLGDILTVFIREENSSEHIDPVRLPLDILYEDEDLLVLNKPAGMPTHPSQNNRDNTLANALAWYFAEQDRPFVFRCINRLDRDTSGLTIVAKHALSAGILSSTMHTAMEKQYLAIVRGSVRPASGSITAPLSRKEGSILEREVDFEKGESAVTHYRLLHEKNGHSLLSLTLETGRTHQIRVHLKYLGYPLIGDYLYNPDFAFMHRQALHACRLRFLHPITKEAMEFTAPLPEDMLWMA